MAGVSLFGQSTCGAKPGNQASQASRRQLSRREGARGAVRDNGGIGPDAVIDAVGMESHGFSFDNIVDAVKTA